MFTSTNYRPFYSKPSLNKSKSTDQFYRRAGQKTMKFLSSTQGSANDCLACKHERKQTAAAGRTTGGFGHNFTAGVTAREEYYEMGDKQELNHLRKSKRYLEQLLERTKLDYKTNLSSMEKRLAEVCEQLQQKNLALTEMQKVQHQKQAQQQYLANASMVRSYKQLGVQDEQEHLERARKMNLLIKRNAELQEELGDHHRTLAGERQKVTRLESDLEKMKEYQFYAKEYEAMRILIDKMEEEKLQLLDRQHIQIQELENRHKFSLNIQAQKYQEVKSVLSEQYIQIQKRDRELRQLHETINLLKDQRFESLQDLLQERQKQCLTLESRLNVLDSEQIWEDLDWPM